MSLTLLYGGTFDPVHAGHLAVARAARAALGADVAFLPAADPPHRPAPGASALQRARMLDLAITGEPGFRVDRRELERPGPSYTAETLRELRGETGPEAPLAWLVGADAFRGLPTWHDWPDLLRLAHFVVAVRPGHDLKALPPELEAACAGRWVQDPIALRAAPAGLLFRLDMPLHPATATELRQRLRNGQGDGGWLAPAVKDYIAVRSLYAGQGRPGGV
jgi:nicotinate-nucleotide adenylyltransferase